MNVQRTAASIALGLVVLGAAGACSDDRGSNRPACRAVNGSATISVHTSICPSITSFSISPGQPTVTTAVELTSSVVDPDSDNLTFTWSATAGVVADPTIANTTYSCDGPGGATITLVVSDGRCEDRASGDVICK